MPSHDPNPSQAYKPGARRDTGEIWSYIWLAYSGFYFITPFLRHDTRYWIESGLIYVVFLALYVGMNRVCGRRGQFLLAGTLLLLGVLDYPRNQGASSFFIYVAGFLPFMLASSRWSIALIAADCALLVGEGAWLLQHQGTNDPINLTISIFFVLVVGASNLVVARGKRADQKLRHAEQEIVALAAVAERERIARDLHDVLGHTLSVIVLKAELAGKLVHRDAARAASEIADVERTARTALAEVREAIGGIRTLALAAEMANARRALDAAGVALTLEETDTAPALNAEVQTVLSLTLREAVTNIVRHAHATHCRVSFTSSAGQHALIVEDDGTHATPREGNGLRGMRERVQNLGGRLSVEIANGTRVRVEIPTSAGVR